jgi:energy-coupling factor transport system permease protein
MGQYVPADSLVHALDPRAKLLLVAVIMFAVFPSGDMMSLSFCALALYCAVRASGLSLGILARSCRPMFFLAFFTFAFNAGAVLWRAQWSSSALLPGLGAGAVAAVRLLLLVSFALLLPLTTTPLSLADGMESVLSPFKRFGFPVHECAMMMGVALRFLPLLMEETDRIVKAQLSRGARLDQGGLFSRMKAFLPVIIPLLIVIFRRADELAMAMEARGYRGGEGRTRRRPLSWKKSDTGATIFVTLVVAGFTFLRLAAARGSGV